MALMVRNREASAVELVQAHLDEMARRNPALNAFSMVLSERALEDAKTAPAGPLQGVPLTVKDSFDIAGLPTNAGSRLRIGHRANSDATAVARLRRAGAIILGKTNTPEFLASYETDNLLTGRTNNPWNLDRTCGGSSGGEAVAIASYCSAGGLGSDGGGSIRVPAHFCGVAGLKPTPGRISGRGHFPSLGHPGGLVTVAGPMARSAGDLRLLFDALTSYDAEDPFSVPPPLRESRADQPRVLVWDGFYDVPVDSEVRYAVHGAASMLENAGFATEEFRPTGLERAPNVWAFLFSQWPAPFTRKLVEGRETEAHWTLMEGISPANPTGEQAIANLVMRDRLRASLLRQMPENAIVLMPVSGITAFPHRRRKFLVEGKEIGLFQAMMPAVLANVLGLAAVTVPIARSREGLPIGIQLMGRPFSDELLLDVAARLETERGAWTLPEPADNGG